MSLGSWALGTAPLGSTSGEVVPPPLKLFPGTIESEEVVTGLAELVIPAAVLLPKTISSGEVVRGGTLVAAPVPAPTPTPGVPFPAQPLGPPRLRVLALDRQMGGAPVELDQAWGQAWQERRNNLGSGGLQLQNDDPDLAALDFNSVLRFSLDDVARFATPVETLHRFTRAVREEHDQFTAVRGRGLVAMWEDMLVLPANGLERQPSTDLRIFNFASVDFDDETWHTPVATPPQYGEPGGPSDPAGENYGFPESWPDADSAWLWDRLNDTIGTPAGVCYFRGPFVTGAPQRVQVWAAADDEYDLYLDGALILSDTGVYRGQSRHLTLDIDAGAHLLAAKVRNLNTLKAGFTCAVMSLNSAGQISGVVHSTNVGSWVMLPYPPTIPGFTPGKIIRLLLDEAQARGGMLGWSLGFDDDVDAGGTPWEITEDIAFRVGIDGASALLQLAEAYIDFRPAAGALRLDAWVAGTVGQDRATQLEPEVNIADLEHEAEG